MKQVRKNTFETNSSSTHSLAVPIQKVKYGKAVSFRIDDFGWDFDTPNPADYLYTAILTHNDKKAAAKYLDKLVEILGRNHIAFTMEEPKWYKSTYDESEYIEEGSIDHSYDLSDFLEILFESDEKVLNFIFGGLVFTGNDNCETEESYFVYRNEKISKEDEYDTSTGKWVTHEVENPYYKEEYDNYQWFFKGN